MPGTRPGMTRTCSNVHHHHRRRCRAAALDPGSDRGDARRVSRPLRREGGQPAAAALQRSGTPDPERRYTANIHAGAVESAGVACVRAGSAFTPVQSARRPQGDRRRRRQLLDHHPLRPAHRRAARLHARDLSLGPARRRDLGAGGVARRARGRRGARPVRHRHAGGAELQRHLRGAADQARPGLQPERRASRRVRQADGRREIRDGRGRRSARGGARRPCRRLHDQFQGAGAQRRVARSPGRWSSPSPIPT